MRQKRKNHQNSDLLAFPEKSTYLLKHVLIDVPKSIVKVLLVSFLFELSQIGLLEPILIGIVEVLTAHTPDESIVVGSSS